MQRQSHPGRHQESRHNQQRGFTGPSDRNIQRPPSTWGGTPGDEQIYGQEGGWQENHGGREGRYGQENMNYGDRYGSGYRESFGGSEQGRFGRQENFHAGNYGMGERGGHGAQGQPQNWGARGEEFMGNGFRNSDMHNRDMDRGLAGMNPAQGTMPRGPKGYKRSDERIREDVCDRLMAYHSVDASEVEIKVSNGEVTLTGTVKDRNAKRLIEDIAESIQGVDEVNNQIRLSRGGYEKTDKIDKIDKGEKLEGDVGESRTKPEEERGTVIRTKRN